MSGNLSHRRRGRKRSPPLAKWTPCLFNLEIFMATVPDGLKRRSHPCWHKPDPYIQLCHQEWNQTKRDGQDRLIPLTSLLRILPSSQTLPTVTSKYYTNQTEYYYTNQTLQRSISPGFRSHTSFGKMLYCVFSGVWRFNHRAVVTLCHFREIVEILNEMRVFHISIFLCRSFFPPHQICLRIAWRFERYDTRAGFFLFFISLFCVALVWFPLLTLKRKLHIHTKFHTCSWRDNVTRSP